MDATSEVISRHREDVLPGALLVNPPDVGLMETLPEGQFASLHYGIWQELDARSIWKGQFGFDLNLETKANHAIVWMPKARRELDLVIAWTQAQLLPNATLWLIGPKRGGIESGGKALKTLFGSGRKRDSARHCQLWEYRLVGHAEVFHTSAWLKHRVMKPGWDEPESEEELIVVDMPGVFSEGRLDEGTKMLLGAFAESPRGPVLDFACGAGIIAAALMKKWPALQLTMLDVQWQALTAARHTLAANEMSAEVIPGNGLSGIKGHFGTIVTNPPFHAGLKTDLNIVRQFLTQAKSHLAPGGALWMVANAFLPYQELLEEHFQKVATIAEDSRFRVYRAQVRDVHRKR